MKKILLFMGVLAIVALSGCGSSDNGEETGSSSNSASGVHVEEIKQEKLQVGSGYAFDHPNDYKPFSDEVQADLEKLPQDVQSYILNGSIHVVEPFVNDKKAREVLIRASEQIEDFNANDVDALIVNLGSNESYEERLESLLSQ